MKRVTHEMGAREITIGYGQTEMSPLMTQTRTDDPLELRVGDGRPAAAGRGSEDRRRRDRQGPGRRPGRARSAAAGTAS